MLRPVKTINAKLLYLIVPAVFLVSMFESFIDNYLDYEERQVLVTEQWQNLATTQASVVSGYLWNFDLEAINSHLESLVEFSEVYSAKVYDEKDNLISSAGFEDGGSLNHQSFTLDIVYQDSFVNRRIGKFILIVAHTDITSRLLDGFLDEIPENILLVLALTGIIIFATRKFLLIPMKDLSQGFLTFDQKKLRHKISVKSTDEVGDLIEGYNRMIDKLEQHEKQQLIYVQGLEAANRAKTYFLANMSHELRTPLNAILGFSEMIKYEMLGKIDEPRYREYADDIYSSGTLLLDIINDILDMSKIEAGELNLQNEVVDLQEITASCFKIMNGRAERNRITLKSNITPDCPYLYGDNTRLRQLLLNLLSNSVKFTPEGGEVVLSAGVNAKSQIEIIVEDNGMGIPDAKIEEVLKPFIQVDSHLTRQHEGTGLGLPLSKSFMELHEGQFILESKLNKGTKATMIFPSERTRKPSEVFEN
ncbi:sensor histidine kinase [Kiloniella antarctica]|uniref:histidine kinase n=1 Tax=Kiloniella antarctica TaxID=1550907 RepID=A0ABW5BFB7_9PROT